MTPATSSLAQESKRGVEVRLTRRQQLALAADDVVKARDAWRRWRDMGTRVKYDEAVARYEALANPQNVVRDER